MAFRSGQNSNAKKLLMRLPPEKGDDALYMLNTAQIKALLSLSQSIAWRTRHLSSPDYIDTQDKLQSFADETALDLMSPVDICTEIVACASEIENIISDALLNNPTLQQAIRDFLLNDPDFREGLSGSKETVPAGELGENFGNVTDCDPDLLFNVITVALDLLNQVSVDVFESIELATNVVERGEVLISAIPVIGAVIPVDEIMSLADQIVSSFQEAYEAAYDEDLEDEIRCAIFCEAKDECDVTIDILIDFYEDRLALSLPQDIIEGVLDILNFLMTGSISGDTIVYAMHLLVLQSLKTVTGAGGKTFKPFAMRLLAAGDEENNDWRVLCEDCPPPPENWQIWTEVGNYGTIIEETSNSLTVYATQQADMGWRIAVRRVNVGDCITIVGFSETLPENPGYNAHYARALCGQSNQLVRPTVGESVYGIVMFHPSSSFQMTVTY